MAKQRVTFALEREGSVVRLWFYCQNDYAAIALHDTMVRALEEGGLCELESTLSRGGFVEIRMGRRP